MKVEFIDEKHRESFLERLKEIDAALYEELISDKKALSAFLKSFEDMERDEESFNYEKTFPEDDEVLRKFEEG